MDRLLIYFLKRVYWSFEVYFMYDETSNISFFWLMSFDNCLHPFDYHTKQNVEHSHDLRKISLAPLQSVSTPPQLSEISVDINQFCCSWAPYINGINVVQVLLCCLVLLNVFSRFSKSIHVATCFSGSFLFTFWVIIWRYHN